MESGLHFATARDLFEEFESARKQIKARPDGEAPLEFLSILASSPTPEEAITFCAYLLPRRKTVWWGHQCVKGLDHLLADQDRHMLMLAERWVREPEETQRYQALEGGMSCPDKTPGVWIALGAGWSGGSMAAPDRPRVPPPAYLTPRAVNVGILGVLARVDGRHRAATLKTFVDMGRSLAAN